MGSLFWYCTMKLAVGLKVNKVVRCANCDPITLTS